jgi:hypothetical protein
MAYPDLGAFLGRLFGGLPSSDKVREKSDETKQTD